MHGRGCACVCVCVGSPFARSLCHCGLKAANGRGRSHCGSTCNPFSCCSLGRPRFSGPVSYRHCSLSWFSPLAAVPRAVSICWDGSVSRLLVSLFGPRGRTAPLSSSLPEERRVNLAVYPRPGGSSLPKGGWDVLQPANPTQRFCSQSFISSFL